MPTLSKEGVRLLLALAVIALLVAIVAIRSCGDAHQKAEQARHDTRTAEAYSGAAQEAVATVSARAGEEAELRVIVNEAAEEIANAEGSDQAVPPAARTAALRAACRLPDYRHEPACRVLATDP